MQNLLWVWLIVRVVINSQHHHLTCSSNFRGIGHYRSQVKIINIIFLDTSLMLKWAVNKVLGRSSPVNHREAMVNTVYFNIQNILCSLLRKKWMCDHFIKEHGMLLHSSAFLIYIRKRQGAKKFAKSRARKTFSSSN